MGGNILHQDKIWVQLHPPLTLRVRIGRPKTIIYLHESMPLTFFPRFNLKALPCTCSLGAFTSSSRTSRPSTLLLPCLPRNLFQCPTPSSPDGGPDGTDWRGPVPSTVFSDGTYPVLVLWRTGRTAVDGMGGRLRQFYEVSRPAGFYSTSD